MSIEVDLLSGAVSETIKNCIQEMKFDTNEIVQSVAISALSEIQKVIKNDNISDFDAIEQIVRIFEKYNMEYGARHDF